MNRKNVIQTCSYKPLKNKSIFEKLLSQVILNSYGKLLRKSQTHIVDFLTIGIDVQELGEVILKGSFPNRPDAFVTNAAK